MTYDPDDLNDREAEINAVFQRAYSVNIGRYLDRSIGIFQQKAGELIGFTVLSIVISLALSNIDYVGSILDPLASGVLGTGYYFFYFRIQKGQNSEFGDFFLGFKNNRFWPILLVNLLMGLVVGGLVIIASTLMGLGLYKPLLVLIKHLEKMLPSSEIPNLPELSIPPGLALIFLILGLLMWIPVIYFSVGYTFAPALVVERRFGAWQAMETSRKFVQREWILWWFFSFLINLIQGAGVFACGIGLLITIPVCYCAIAAAYEDAIGLSQRNSLPEAE